MAQLKLSYEGLSQEGEKVLALYKEYTVIIQKVMKTAENLNSQWDDEAARDFTEKVKKMDPSFKQFGEVLEGLAKHMKAVSKKYEELSKEIKKAQSSF